MVEGQEDELALRHYLSVLWRQKYLVAAMVVVAAVAGFLLGSRQDDRYRSDVQILLQQSTAELLFSATVNQGSGSQGGRDAGLTTEIAVMTSRSIRDAVAEKVGGPFQVKVQPVEGSRLVVLVATDEEPARAREVAETYADTYVSTRRQQIVDELLRAIETVQAEITALDAEVAGFDAPLAEIDRQLATSLAEPAIRALQTQRADLLSRRQPLEDQRNAFKAEVDKLQLASSLTTTGGAQIVGAASEPRLVAQTGSVRSGLAAAVAGATLGVLLAFAREHFGARISARRDVLRISRGAPVLTSVPPLRRRERSRDGAELVVSRHPQSPVTEAFRRLRSGAALGATGPGHSVLITSPSPGDGKTFTTANLALALARAGQRTIVVDADLHRPRLHEYFRLPNDRGVTTVLEGGDLGAAIQTVAGEKRLRVLTSGPPVPEPSELLARHDLGEWVLGRLAGVADVVVVDSPPLLAVADTSDLAASVRAVVLVVREGQTRRDDLARACEMIEQLDVPLVGTVLNASRSGRTRATYRYYRSDRLVTQSGARPRPTPRSGVGGDGSGAGSGNGAAAPVAPSLVRRSAP